jgi:ADP-ribose pyrophosphatase YjhB (NUDIX family)
MKPRWLEWAQELQSISQNGLTYCTDTFDMERFMQVRRIAAEMLAAHSDIDLERITGLFENETGYATPKVDVRGAIIRDAEILLVQELNDDSRWTLPGGWADPGDTPSEAMLREIVEETGYTARTTKLAAVYDRTRQGHAAGFFSAYKLYFLCEITGGAAASSSETGAVKFFKEEQLAGLDLSLARVTLAQLHMLFKHARQPELPTEYD